MRSQSNVLTYALVLASLMVAVAAAAFAAGSGRILEHPPNAAAQELLHLKSQVVQNDGSDGHKLYLEGDAARPFGVPAGQQFVITDILIEPVFCPATTNALYMVAIDLVRGGARRFNARFVGSGTEHLDFAGGLVVPAGQTPTFRNLSASASPVEVTVIGHYAPAAQ